MQLTRITPYAALRGIGLLFKVNHANFSGTIKSNLIKKYTRFSRGRSIFFCSVTVWYQEGLDGCCKRSKKGFFLL